MPSRPKCLRVSRFDERDTPMTQKMTSAAALLALAALSGCAQRPQVTAAPPAEMSAYRTFTISHAVATPVAMTIRSELEKRHYVYNADAADFKVLVQIAGGDQAQASSNVGSRFGAKGSDPRDLLVVAFVDSKSQDVIWRASARGAFKEDNAEVSRAIGDLLVPVAPVASGADGSPSAGSPSRAP